MWQLGETKKMVAKRKKEKQTDSEKLLCPKAGTATSSPETKTSPSLLNS